MTPDPFNLARFVKAQDDTYSQAIAELKRGRKTSHWMWFIFPQVEGLGLSPTSVKYAIHGTEEAEAYLEHPVLGPRLEECCQAILALQGRSAHEIFGSPDDMKLRSSMTLFAAVSPDGSIFEKVLRKYFDGERDEKTLEVLDIWE
jgi:uncharacterized protein (DUF1810 family)